MSLLSAISVDDLRARGTLTDLDIAALRRAFAADGIIDAAEADVLVTLHHMPGAKPASWDDCFVELVADHIVLQASPEGYLTLENAEWLVGRIAHTGAIESLAELDLLLCVLDKARWSPQSLVAFTLEQIRRAVVENSGPLRMGKSMAAGQIDETDVELVKRILYAYAGDANLAITRGEAELLFEIDAGARGGDGQAGWSDLFVKAMANCALAASGYATPCREQALARRLWVQRLGEAGGTSPVGILAAYRMQSSEQRAIVALERQKIEIVTSEEVAVADAAWIAERLTQDGALSANAQALIDLLAASGADLAPELAALAGRFGKAAVAA